MNARRWGLLLEVAWWMAACTGVWLLTLSSVSWPDLVVAGGLRRCPARSRPGPGAGPSAATGGPGCAGWPGSARWPLPSRPTWPGCSWWRRARRRPRAGDGPPGRFQRVTMPPGEPVPVASARHALATLTISASPGSLVIDSDPAAGTMDAA